MLFYAVQRLNCKNFQLVKSIGEKALKPPIFTLNRQKTVLLPNDRPLSSFGR